MAAFRVMQADSDTNGTVEVRRGFRLWPEHAAAWYVAALFALYAAVLLTSYVAPSLTDYCDWTYEGLLFRNHLLGLPDAAHVFKHYPVPNSAGTVGIGILSLVFPWQVAAKIWLSFLLVLAFVVTHFMLLQRKGSSPVWLIAPAGCFLSVNLWYGFVNFQLGLCLTIVLATLLLRDTRREAVLGLLLILTFFSHMIPFMFSSLIVCLYALQRRRPRLLYQLIPGAMLSTWYVCGRLLIGHNADGNAGMVGAVRNYSAAFWAYKVNSYLKSLGFVNPGTESGSVSLRIFGPELFILLFVFNIVLCTIVAWYLIRTGIHAYREGKQERFLWAAGVIFTCLYLVAPATMLGISDPGSRLLQTSLGVLVLLLTSERRSAQTLMRCAAGCAVALQVAGLFLFIRVVLSPAPEAATFRGIPRRIVAFAHVPNHGEDYFYRALERGDMRLRIFPTAMFLNTESAELPPVDRSTRNDPGELRR